MYSEIPAGSVAICYSPNTFRNALSKARALHRRVREEGVTISVADAISSTSADILKQTRIRYGLALASASVIPAPAPVVPARDRWRLEECNRNHILFVGRFDRHKGGDVVIDGFRIVAQKFPQLRLKFAGTDPGFRDDDGQCWPIGEYLRQRAPEVAGRVEWLEAGCLMPS